MESSYEPKNKLNKLEKKLYSRGAPTILDKGRSEINSASLASSPAVQEQWSESEEDRFDALARRVSQIAEKKHTFVKKIFTISIVVFLLSLVAAGFVFLGGGNIVSSKNVDIKVAGPITVSGGQEASFDVTILNGNNTELNSVSMIVEYPVGTRSPVDLSQELRRERFAIGSIGAGESYTEKISGVFFGEKESIKPIKIILEYRVEKSSANFIKEKLHEISISSAPVIITPIYPKEVNSNQDITFVIEVASNSKDTLNGLLLKVEYPFGFVYNSSSQPPLAGNNTWVFPKLTSGEKKTISIRGTVIGQDNEERVFRISSGTQSDDDERIIAVPLVELTESLTVKKPFISLITSVGGKSTGDYPASGGSSVPIDVTIRNNLPSQLFNFTATVSLRGAALNESTIVPGQNGFYRSSDDTIIWDAQAVPQFRALGPGEEVRLTFRMTPLSYSSVPQGSRPEIEMNFNTNGERVLDSGSAEIVRASDRRKIVLSTDIGLSTRIVRSQGTIENYGPIPPKVDTPTSYTVIWNIANSFNQVSNVEVRAKLPNYVTWKDVVSPSGEVVTYNNTTGEVVWNAGSILPNTGIGTTGRQVAFQIEFLPSVSQIGAAPMLIDNATLTGTDKVTGIKVQTQAASQNTVFSSDPAYQIGNDKVVK